MDVLAAAFALVLMLALIIILAIEVAWHKYHKGK